MRYLVKIKNHWYFNMRVSNDLVGVLKVRVLKKSLHTTSYKNAKIMAHALVYKAERIFMMARTGMISDEQIRRMMADFKNDQLRDFEEQRAGGYSVPDRRDMHDEELEPPLCYGPQYLGYEELEGRYREALVLNDLAEIEPDVDELLRNKGITPDKQSVAYKKLCREMLRAWVYIAQIEKQRIEGNYDNEHDKGLVSEQQTHPALSKTSREVSNDNETDGEDILLSEAVELFIREKRATEGDRVNENSLEDFRSIHKVFREIVGDVPVRSLNGRKDFIEFRETLNLLPRNMRVVKEWKNKPIAEILEVIKDKPEIKRISPATRTKYMTRINTLMQWCETNGYTDRNYAKNLAKKPTSAETPRLCYTVEQLQKLLDSPVCRTSLPLAEVHQFFIPLIALFTGMRENEICQLYVEDVYVINGCHCIDINENTPDKRVKGHKRRVIPIHPTLIDIGFLEYVEQMRRQGHKRLWIGTQYENRCYKHKFSKWYAGYCDAYITDDKRLNFHCFRNTFITNLENNGVHESHAAGITGHAHKAITFKVYGHGYEPQNLVEPLMKLNYEGLNFDGIKWPVTTHHK
jgi:integrase